MALQVGSLCYATQADAAAAACASVVPTSSVVGTSVVTLSCAGVNADGALLMQTSVSPIDGSTAAQVSEVAQPVVFSPCTQGDLVAALEVCIGAALGCWAIWWGGRKLLDLLSWGRGEVL